MIKELQPLFGFPLLRTTAFIYTEGKTDVKHLKAALAALKAQGSFANLDLKFRESEEAEGYDELLNRLKHLSEAVEPHNSPHIFMFDGDVKGKTFEELKGNQNYHSWENKVYSFIIPAPEHRKGMKEVCIEFYYRDNDIVIPNEKGHRLFLSNEFNPKSGMHLVEELTCKEFNKLKGEIKILDSNVCTRNGENVALSKNDFADKILGRRGSYASVDFSAFSAIFERISIIVDDFDQIHK
jgi:RNA-directed DNA polymerase